MTKLICFITALLISLNMKSQTKISPRIDLQYFQEDSLTRFLKIHARRKLDKKFEPVQNLEIAVYQEKGNESNRLGSIITNAKGEGTLFLPENIKKAMEDQLEYQFTAKALPTSKTEAVSESLTIIPGRLKIVTDGEDEKMIRITLQSKTAEGWTPLPDAEVNVFVKRRFGQLQVGEDMYTTDENGLVEVLFANQIPGDEKGNIIIGCAVEDNDQLGNLYSSTTTDWGIPLKTVDHFNDRTLWATRDKTPFWLLIFPNLIIASVWTVIGYLLFQIYKMKRLSHNE
jgi:hypothetical protein